MAKLELNNIQERKVRDIKNHIHKYPELSWEEYETTNYIKSYLSTMANVEIIDLPIKTGVVAKICGNEKGKTVALRADIDAINASEDVNIAERSQRNGIMHACGHDFHTACLLGAAALLNEIKNELNGEVILIFQPAEETTNGAQYLIDKGLLDKCKIDYIFGLHNRPEIPSGKIVLNKGGLMSAKDNFRITIQGKGGHGSMPQKCKDPIICSAALIEAVQTIVSRNIDPLQPAVASICSIHAGTPENLIVDTAVLTGSIRTFDKGTRDTILARLETLTENIALSYECKGKLEVLESLPALINSEKMYRSAEKTVVQNFGSERIVSSEPSLASEDFSVYLNYAEGFFYWLGTGTNYPWHNSKFRTDDDMLKLGSELLANSAKDKL